MKKRVTNVHTTELKAVVGIAMVQPKAIHVGSVPGTTTFCSQSATILDASFFSSLYVVFGLNRFLLSSLYVVLTARGSLCHSFDELTMVVGDFTSRSAAT